MFSRVYICLISVSTNEPFICAVSRPRLFRNSCGARRHYYQPTGVFFFFSFTSSIIAVFTPSWWRFQKAKKILYDSHSRLRSINTEFELFYSIHTRHHGWWETSFKAAARLLDRFLYFVQNHEFSAKIRC